MKIELSPKAVQYLVWVLDASYDQTVDMDIEKDASMFVDFIGIMKDLIVGNQSRDEAGFFEASEETINFIMRCQDAFVDISGGVPNGKMKLKPETMKALKKRFNKDAATMKILANDPLALV